jgi:hypothetical protein
MKDAEPDLLGIIFFNKGSFGLRGSVQLCKINFSKKTCNDQISIN